MPNFGTDFPLAAGFGCCLLGLLWETEMGAVHLSETFKLRLHHVTSQEVVLFVVYKTCVPINNTESFV
jgi:hypothetical protein